VKRQILICHEVFDGIGEGGGLFDFPLLIPVVLGVAIFVSDVSG
jgi:hypothetical protein